MATMGYMPNMAGDKESDRSWHFDSEVCTL